MGPDLEREVEMRLSTGSQVSDASTSTDADESTRPHGAGRGSWTLQDKMHSMEAVRTFARYVPQLCVERFVRSPEPLVGPQEEHVTAALFFADISGFVKIARIIDHHTTRRERRRSFVGTDMMDQLTSETQAQGSETPNNLVNRQSSASGMDAMMRRGSLKNQDGSDGTGTGAGPDVSGVTGEELRNMLNRYFSRLIEVITSHGGDVLKFAGDALIAIWPIGKGCGDDLAEVVLRATACGIDVQKKLDNFDIGFSNQQLRAKVTVAAGNIHCMHVGGVGNRWEFFVAGTPLRQIETSSGLAQPGDVVLSREAFEAVGEAVASSPVGESPTRKVDHIVRSVPPIELHMHTLRADMRQGLGGYIPGVVKAWLAAGQESWLAEIRLVTVLFMNIIGIDYTSPAVLEKVQSAVTSVQNALYRYEGSLRQFLVEDKGSTLIAAFGLPPVSHEDDAWRAVVAAMLVKEQLSDLGLAVSIGITTGRVFCGNVGSETRCEYAMTGDNINLAARLMAKSDCGIFVDSLTHRATKDKIRYEFVGNLTIKGKESKVQAFQPIGLVQEDELRKTASQHPLIIGRVTERMAISDKIHELSRGNGGLMVIEGSAGIGKTTLAKEVGQIASFLRIPVLEGAGYSLESRTPFFAWRSLIRQLVADPMSPANTAAMKLLGQSDGLMTAQEQQNLQYHLAFVLNQLGTLYRRGESTSTLTSSPRRTQGGGDTPTRVDVGNESEYHNAVRRRKARERRYSFNGTFEMSMVGEGADRVVQTLKKTDAAITQSVIDHALKDQRKNVTNAEGPTLVDRVIVAQQELLQDVPLPGTQDTILSTVNRRGKPRRLSASVVDFAVDVAGSTSASANDTGVLNRRQLSWRESDVPYDEIASLMAGAVPSPHSSPSPPGVSPDRHGWASHGSSADLPPLRGSPGASPVRQMGSPFRPTPSMLGKLPARTSGVWGDTPLEMLVPLLGSVVGCEFPDNEHTKSLTGATRMQALNELLQLLLKKLSNDNPVVLTFDDVQWLDSSSWSLIHTCTSMSNILVVLVTRTINERLSEDVKMQINKLKVPGTMYLRLDALSFEDIVQLVCRKLGVDSHLPDAVAVFINEKSQGNPFFASELTDTVVQNGMVEIVDGECVLKDSLTNAAQWGVPDSITGIIRARIDKLNPSSQIVLKIASVIGRNFDTSVLQRVLPAEISPKTMESQIKSLVANNVLTVDPENPMNVSFRHVLVQEVSYGLLPYTARQRIHHAIAAWYEMAYAEDMQPVLPVLAYHWGRVGNHRKAVKYLEQGGEKALATCAMREAVLFFSEALAVLVDQMDDSSQGSLPDVTEDEGGKLNVTIIDQARWLRHLGEAYLGLGNVTDAQRNLEQVLELLNEPLPNARRSGLVRQGLKQLWHRLIGRGNAAGKGNAGHFAMIKRTLSSSKIDRTVVRKKAIHLGVQGEKSRAHARLFEIYYFGHEIPLATHSALVATNTAEMQGLPAELMRGYVNLSLCAAQNRMRRLSKFYSKRALLVEGRIREPDPVSSAWVHQMVALRDLGWGHWDSARAALSKATKLADTQGDLRRWEQLQAMYAYVLYLQGEVVESCNVYQRVHSSGYQRGDVQTQGWGLLGMARSGLHHGNSEDAMQLLQTREEMIRRYVGRGVVESDVNAIAQQALLNLRMCNLSDALSEAEKVLHAIAEDTTVPSIYALTSLSNIGDVYFTMYAEALRSSDNHSVVSELRRPCSMVVAHLHKYGQTYPIGRPRHLMFKAVYELLAGNVRTAKKTLNAAVSAATSLGWGFEAGMVLLETSVYFPKAETRLELLDRAKKFFEALGALSELDRLACLYAEATTSPTGSAGLPAGRPKRSNW